MKRFCHLFFGLWMLWLSDSEAGPAMITDLCVTNVSGSNLGYMWTVPIGAVSNDVRISTSPISVPNFRFAERIPPYLAGSPSTKQSAVIYGRMTNTTYYIAVKTIGTNGVSTMSTLAMATTGGAYGTICVAWDPPSNAFCSAQIYVAGYELLYGTVSRIYTHTQDVGGVTTGQVDQLERGITNYFSVRAYSNFRDVTDLSKELSWRPP